MKKLFLLRFTFMALMLTSFSSVINAAVSVELSVENQKVVGTDFYFDVFVHTTPGSDALYLTHSDFVLTFNKEYFSNPKLEKVGTGKAMDTGYCTLTSEKSEMGARQHTYSNTSAVLIDNYLILNVNGMTPTTKEGHNNMPKADNKISKYCLGRFKVSGISDNRGTMGLAWQCEGLRSTKVFTIDGDSFKAVGTSTVCNSIENMRLPGDVELAGSSLELNVYPNPAREVANLSVTAIEDGEAFFSVYNTLGERVQNFQKQITKGVNEFQMKTEELASGVYYVETKLGNETRTLKFMVE